MPTIFQKSLQVIDDLTLMIRDNAQVVCQGCSKALQFVPHGWLYKLDDDGTRRKVGKRIICSARRGGEGCGRTMRILVREETHRLHVRSLILWNFVLALSAGICITEAYGRATGSPGSRNAWRWWARLRRREGDIRTHIFGGGFLPNAPSSPVDSHRTDHPLRSILKNWALAPTDSDPCADFQLTRQIALL